MGDMPTRGVGFSLSLAIGIIIPMIGYEVIPTLGPASEAESTWRLMLEAGATAFRLNTSHLSLDELGAWLDRLEPFLSAVQPPVSIVLDLQGSKWRLGAFTPCELIQAQRVRLVYAATSDSPGVLPVPHADLFTAAQRSTRELVLNDAKVKMRVEAVGPDWLEARVVQPGGLAPHKGITFTNSSYRIESLNEKDRLILERTRGIPIRYAISYVRDAAEMQHYRELFGSSAYLAAKIERLTAVDEAVQIAAASDEIWLCRGDLGAELGMAEMARAVHDFGELAGKISIPLLMAGQVLEHMTAHITPTRSEVCYLYDVLRRGYRGVVLSDETAIGSYPVEACRAAALFKKV